MGVSTLEPYKKTATRISFVDWICEEDLHHSITLAIMNIIPAALIAVFTLCGILGVDALKCYSCTDKSNNTDCNLQPVKTCEGLSRYCFTELEKLINQKWKINKRCAEINECSSANYNVMFMSKHTSCCTGDLCNELANGTTNVKYNAFLILAAVLALGIFKNI